MTIKHDESEECLKNTNLMNGNEFLIDSKQNITFDNANNIDMNEIIRTAAFVLLKYIYYNKTLYIDHNSNLNFDIQIFEFKTTEINKKVINKINLILLYCFWKDRSLFQNFFIFSGGKKPNYLQELGIDISMFLVEWFYTFYTRAFSLEFSL